MSINGQDTLLELRLKRNARLNLALGNIRSGHDAGGGASESPRVIGHEIRAPWERSTFESSNIARAGRWDAIIESLTDE